MRQAPIPIKTVGFFLLITIALIIVSDYTLDRPIAMFVYAHHSRDIPILVNLSAEILDVILGVVFLVYLFFMIQTSFNRHSPLCNRLLVMSNTVVISIFMKSAFKLLCGRLSAETFLYHQPSLSNSEFYGFHWFAFNSAWSSFPSGHTTVIVAFSTSMWFLFPTLRWLWCAMAILVSFLLIELYYHFLSDVIGGAALGYLVAIYYLQSSKYAVSSAFFLRKAPFFKKIG